MNKLLSLKLMFLGFIIILSACNQDKLPLDETTQDSILVKEKTTTQIIDELYVKPLDFEYNQIDFGIYRLVSYDKSDSETDGFVSLSEIYSYSENSDSLAIPEEYLGQRKEDDVKYVKLTSVYRQRFLNGTKLKDSDKVFIYNYYTDSLLIFAVKDLPVIACLSIYTSFNGPVTQDDYQIGFGIDRKLLKGFGDNFHKSLVCFGKENPFVKGKMKPIVWKKIEPEAFPSNILGAKDLSKLPKYIKGDTYRFEMDSLNYYVQDMEFKKDYIWRHLIVLKSNNTEILYEDMYYNTEGSSLAPLNYLREDFGLSQWTGLLFKNKPPVIFGFEYISFGCESINFLNQSREFISILCDNRH